MRNVNRAELRRITESYESIYNEGILDRVGANAAGVWQGVKNVGAGIKATGQALTGNLAGAKATVDGMVDQSDARVNSIIQSASKNFLTDIIKLKLIDDKGAYVPDAKDIQDIAGLLGPIITQLKAAAVAKAAAAAAPAAGTAGTVPAPAPAGTTPVATPVATPAA